MSVRNLQRLEAGWNMTIIRAARLANKYGRLTRELFDPVTYQPRQPGRPRKHWLATVQERELEKAREREQRKSEAALRPPKE